MDRSTKIRAVFPDLCIYKDSTRPSLFGGRNLPAYIQEYLLMRFTNASGVIDKEALRDYLDSKMTTDSWVIRRALLAGETPNLTCAFSVTSDLADGRTAFTLSDIELGSKGYILPSIVEDNKDTLSDGKTWGNITLEYVPPEGRKKGYVNMISFRPFKPIEVVDLGYYKDARRRFDFQEWLDVLITGIGYAPEAFTGDDDEDTIIKKCEFLTRLTPAVEPRLNLIELGPKGTGKSYLYNNPSKYLCSHDHGNTTIAEMFYNRLTKRFGPLKTHDVVAFDEVTSMRINGTEVRSPIKCYLENGKATFGNVDFHSECGLVLMGNILLTADYKPAAKDYFLSLPFIFRDSAVLDRFHGFIEGWKIPRLSVESIYRGWGINTEYLSEVFHSFRTHSEYGDIFDELVSFDGCSDLRDVKAVKKLASAYCKLFFPHVTNLAELNAAEYDEFKDQYEKYCLRPAIEKRRIIRQQCHLLDKEYQLEMPSFYVDCNDNSAPARSTNSDVAEKSPALDTMPVWDGFSAPPEGLFYVHSLFLSEGEFKIGKKEHLMDLIKEAEHWIEKQAAKYGKRLDFLNGTTGFDGTTFHARTPKDMDCPDCSGTDANYYLGLASEHFNVEQLLFTTNDVGCDKAILLVNVDAEGSSFSGRCDAEDGFIGTAIIYGDENLELKLDVVVRELLKLLGAESWFNDFAKESERNTA